MNREIKRSAIKRKKMRSLDSRPYRIAYAVIVAGLLIYVTAYLTALGYQNSIGLERGIKSVKTEQKQKLDRIRDLKEEKIKLHDIEYLKEIARKELYLMPPSEVYIKIIPDPSKSQENSSPK